MAVQSRMFPPERVAQRRYYGNALFVWAKTTASSASRAIRFGRRRRAEKPHVSAFISAEVPKILALEPNLVLTFSDLQAEIVAVMSRGYAGFVHNVRRRALTPTPRTALGRGDGAANIVATGLVAPNS